MKRSNHIWNLGLHSCGFEVPTEIQRDSLMLTLRAADVLGAAQTGSGKTLAFIIPVRQQHYCIHY
jgi:superfamily II DNA/RNA helicase